MRGGIAWRYGGAVAVVLAATAVRQALDPILGDRLPFGTYHFAVMVTAWYWGLGPSLVTLALGSLTATWLFIMPAGQPRLISAADWVGLVLYMAVGLALVLFSAEYQAARRRLERELAERRRAEAEAKQQEARAWQEREQFRITLQSIGDAVIVTDAQGRVTLMNAVAEDLTAWRLDQAAGRSLDEVMPITQEATGQVVENLVARALREGGIVGLSHHSVLTARDGTVRPIEDSAAPIRDADGAMIGVVLSFRDVTQRRRWEQQLIESEERHRCIAKLTSDFAVTARFLAPGELVIESVTEGFYKVTGYTLADISDPGEWSKLIHPEDLPVARQTVERLWASQSSEGEMRFLTPDGQVRWIHYLCRVVGDPGRPHDHRVYCAGQDVTEKKQAERRRNARLAVTQILAEANSGEEAAPRLLQVICESLDWDVGGFWVVDQDAERIRCREVWRSPTCDASAFEADTRHRSFAIGVGLPGRVWSARRPAWIPDVTRDTNFPRAAVALQAGLHGAFGCPIIIDDHCLGVIEFFSHEIREPDADLLEMMATVGGLIGQFLKRRRTEAQLQRSEQELADFFENASVGLHWVGPDGIIQRVNRAELELLGYAREEYVGRHIAEFHADQETIAEILRRLQAGETLHEYEARLRCKDGSIRHVLINSNVLWEEGRFIHTRCFTRDVTERRRAEQALRQSEQRIRLALEAGRMGTWEWNIRTNQITWSDSLEPLHGLEPGSFEGSFEAFQRLIHPEDRERVNRAIADSVAQRSGFETEFRVVWPDGAVHWMLGKGRVFTDEQGQPERMIGLGMDITERKQVEERLREQTRIADTLNRVGSSLAAELDLEKLVQMVTDEATKLIDAEFGAFFYTVTDERGESFTLFTISGVPRERFEGFPLPRNTPLFETTYRGLGIVRLDDVTQDARYGRNPPYHGLPEGHLPVRSYLGAPVVSRSGEVLGGLFFGHSHVGVFSEGDERIIAGMAAQAAIAIDNARLFLQVQEAEHRYRDLVNGLDAIVWEADLETLRFTFVSQQAEEILGYPVAQWSSEENFWINLIHPEDRAQTVDLCRQATFHGRNHELEYRAIRADGQVVWLHDIVYVVKDSQGVPYCLRGLMLDITERKRTEEELHRHAEALRASEERFRQLADAMPQIVWVARGFGQLEFLNRQWFEYTGQTREEAFDPDAWTRVVHPDDMERVIEAARQLDEGRPFQVEYRLRQRSSGQYRWFLGRAVLVRDEASQVTWRYGTATDIHDQKQAAEALRQSEEQFRTLADSIPQLAWMARPDGHIFWFNKRWYDYTGTTFEPMEGWGWQSVHDPDHLPRVLETYKAAIASGQPWEDTFPIRRHDGAMRWHLSRALPVKDEQGRVVRWFGTNTDITERREMEEALRQADRHKDEFLAMLAHELRNPLAPIRNALQVIELEHGRADRQIREMMTRQVEHMTRLVDDLMDVSRITRGKIELRKEVVDLARGVERSLEMSRALIEERQQTLTVSLPEEPIRLEADPTRLEQILDNLVNNAAKYTDPGGRIWLEASVDGAGVEIRVRDTGIGIAPEMVPRIFDLFVQAERRLDRAQGGLGIGLSLVRNLVQMHGGQITAHSEGLGRGSTFKVRLPILVGPVAEPQAERPSAEATTNSAPRRRILVVDDNLDAAHSLARLLMKLWGQEVQIAHDGPTALEIARTFQPEVVLLDIGLPGLSGYDVARRLRQKPQFRDALLVALTGWGQEDDRRRSREAGFDLHLVKPVDPAVLRELLITLRAAPATTARNPQTVGP